MRQCLKDPGRMETDRSLAVLSFDTRQTLNTRHQHHVSIVKHIQTETFCPRARPGIHEAHLTYYYNRRTASIKP